MGKTIQVTTVDDEIVVGYVYGVNLNLQLMVLVQDKLGDPKSKEIKIINLMNITNVI